MIKNRKANQKLETVKFQNSKNGRDWTGELFTPGLSPLNP
jgi:hypothetical protein